MGKRNLFFAGLAFMLMFGACKLNPNVQHEGAPFLHGVWVQDSIPFEDELIQYTIHELTFRCDSVYAVLKTHSKARNIPDSCYGDGTWTEFAKAVYVVRGDSLLVDGRYTREDWIHKTTGCHSIGQYTPRFKIIHHSDNFIELHNRFDQRPVLLRKTKHLDCTPQAR